MNKKRFLMFSSALCIALVVLMLPVGAMAQRDRYEGRDRNDRGRYDRDRDDRGRYERRYSKRQVGETIARVEQSSNRFRRDLDAALDRSRLDGSKREDKINEDVKRFEQALNRLRSEFDRRDSWWETRNNVEQALETARDVSTRLRNNSFGRHGRNVQAQWRDLRRDLNTLASRYNLPLV
jgi:hypothetical protein